METFKCGQMAHIVAVTLNAFGDKIPENSKVSNDP